MSSVEFVRWVTENNRPFQIVNDRGFQSLMRTGRPECYIPSPEILSRDVKSVFVHVRARVAKGLQVRWVSSYKGLITYPVLKEYDGKFNFAVDSWSSPNHKAYVAMTIHFECAGKPFSMLLDIVEVAESHTGVNLGIAFTNVLKNFSIEEKVSDSNCNQRTGVHSPATHRFLASPAIMHPTMMR